MSTTPDTLYLEVDEEIPSVIEKLKHQPTDEAVLVVPAGSSLVQSVVNVKLLKRAAEKAKKRLALVTTDPVGRHIASQVGVPVFVSVKDRRSIEPPRSQKTAAANEEVDLRPVVVAAPAGVSVHHYGEPVEAGTMPKSPEPPAGFAAHAVVDEVVTDEPSELPAQPTKTEPEASVPALRLNITPPPAVPSKSTSRNRLPGVTGGLIVIGLLAALWYYYPHAVVALTVATEPFEAKPTVTIDSSKQLVNDTSGATIVGDHLEESADATKEVAATGTKDAGTKATGTAALQNRLGQAVKLSSGTTLASSTVSFVSTADVTIPAATASVDGTGAVVVTPGTATVAIQAALPGDSGNIAGGTALGVSGVSESVASKVSASASGALIGGTTKQVQVVAQADVDQAKQGAAADATTAAKQKIAGGLSGKKLLDDATRTTTTSDALSAKVGDEADKVSDKATVKAEAIVFDESAARDAIVRSITATIPAGKMLVLTDKDPITSSVTSIDWSAGTFKLASDVKTTLAVAVDRSAILKALTGKSLAAAEAALAQQPGIQHADFTFRPGWLKRLPNRSSAIELKFSQATPSS